MAGACCRHNTRVCALDLPPCNHRPFAALISLPKPCTHHSAVKQILILPCCSAVYTLPYAGAGGATQLFMFNCDNGAVLNLAPDNTWSQYRDIPASLWPTPNFCGAMSMAGTATILMLEPASGYAAEVVMFGGYRRGNRECCLLWPASAVQHKLPICTVHGNGNGGL